MRGVGDEIKSIDVPAAPLHLVLVTPSSGCATAAVYATWDTLGGPVSPRVLEPRDEWSALAGGAGWRNDLEPAALALTPGLAEFREQVAAIAGSTPLLCGSGSTYFVLAGTRDEVEHIAHEARGHLDSRCVAVATVGTTRPS